MVTISRETEAGKIEKKLDSLREGKDPEAYKELLSNLKIETVTELILRERQLADEDKIPETYYKELLSNLDKQTIKEVAKQFVSAGNPFYALFQLGLADALGDTHDGKWHRV